jgi:aminomethyltransferase
LDLASRGKIVARGEDRVRLLHAMTTNHVEQLAPGGGCYAFLLDSQGHILGDVNLFCEADHLLLDTEPETSRKIFEHINRYIIADDVTLEDTTASTATLAIEGPQAAEVLASLGAPVPEAAHAHVEWGPRTVARVDSTGAGGFFLFFPTGEKSELARQLEAAGAAAATPEDALIVRLENGRPRYGEDITEGHIPQETQMLHAVHFNKGCYIGQEIVERVRSRGHVNRLLVRLAIDGERPPAPGTKFTAGEITSSAYSPTLGKVIAFGYVRAEHARAGNKLLVDGAPAEVMPSV